MNRYVSSTLLALAGATTLSAPSAVSAQTAANDDGTRVGVGAALLLAHEGYRGVGSETRLLPGVSVQNKWVSLYGPQLDLRLLGSPNRSWWFGPRIEYRFDGFEPADSPFLAGMAERKAGLFAGVAAQFDLGSGYSLELDAVRAGKSERGMVASLELGRTWRLGDKGRVAIKPRIGFEYTSAKYVGHYYGVLPGEATAARAAYAGKAATSLELGLDLRWRMAPQHFSFANLNYERYASAIRNSPIIDKKGIPQLVVGYQYLFE